MADPMNEVFHIQTALKDHTHNVQLKIPNLHNRNFPDETPIPTLCIGLLLVWLQLLVYISTQYYSNKLQ